MFLEEGQQGLDVPVGAAPLGEQVLKQVLFGDELGAVVAPDDRVDEGALLGPLRQG